MSTATIAQAAAPELGNSEARVRLAASAATPPAVLLRLARDEEVLVRATVAMNPAAVPPLNDVLVRDTDERVRALLGRKLAGLLPRLSRDGQSSALAHVVAALGILVADEAVRVRSAITEVVKSMPEVPRDMLLRLAWDAELPVSEPVIRLSALLTDADLIALLATPPHARAATAVAQRAGLSAAVAGAVVAHADTGAVRALLVNPSAAIQETTLDALVGQAVHHATWHEPLVRRAGLSIQSARALSGFVARELLECLLQRADLDRDLAVELRLRVFGMVAPPRGDLDGDEALLSSLRTLKAAGGLTEAELLDAARKGDCRRVAAILAVASGVAFAAVDRAVATRSAKALISLVWKAGFTMAAGNVVPAMLGQLAPGTLDRPAHTGGFPLSPNEMSWHLEVLTTH